MRTEDLLRFEAEWRVIRQGLRPTRVEAVFFRPPSPAYLAGGAEGSPTRRLAQARAGFVRSSKGALETGFPDDADLAGDGLSNPLEL